MPLVTRVRPRLGDIVELPTGAGLGYAQYTHKHEGPAQMGALIRVLPGLFQVRPKSFERLAHENELFHVFFPLGAALNRRILTIVANEPIPPHARAFPRMRAPGFVDRDGRVLDWWLYDGTKPTKVSRVTEEFASLSPYEVWNDTLLFERVASGWTPALDRRLAC